MRKFIGFIFFWILLLVATTAYPADAPYYLACDPPLDGAVITQSQVEITKGTDVQTVAGIATIRGADFLLYDLTSLSNGQYRFRARWAEASGWWSEWSDPLAAKKVGRPGLRIVQ